MHSVEPLDPEFLRKHSVRDHVLFGLAGLFASVLLIAHTVTDVLDSVWRVWPIPWLLVSIYFTFHAEPNVKLRYPTWLSSWQDNSTVTHRIINIGGVIASVVELGIVNANWNNILLLLILPVGQVGAGVLFYMHHHPGEPSIIGRQHDIMATSLLLAGFALGGARLLDLQPFANAWPWMMAVIAYLFLTYSEEGPLGTHEHPAHEHPANH